MVLVIVRHGKAEAESEDGTDAGRVLTLRGMKQAAWLAMLLHDVPVDRPVRVLSSPIARARQTAEIIGKELGVETEFDARLSTERSTMDVFEAVHEVELHDPPETLTLVGHNPHFERLVHELDEAASAFRPLRTGEACIMGFVGEVRRRSGCVLSWERMEEDHGQA